MKKLLELKKLEKLVRLKLLGIKLPENALVCYHSHYDIPTFSIYINAEAPVNVLHTDTCTYFIDNSIDEQIADEIISQIERIEL